jgi:HK97 family phage major capsid protein
MNEKLKKLYAKSDLLMAKIEELQAKGTLTEAEDLELTNAINDCTKVEDDISREVKADKLREVRNQPENSPWRPGNLQIASNGITKDFKDFGDFLSSVKNATVNPGNVDKRLTVQNAASGLNETIDPDGGFLVQTDFVQTLMEDTYETGMLPKRCRPIKISSASNSLTMNGVDESSRVNGSRSGGVEAFWEGEADQMSGTKPKFRKIDLKLRKLTGLCYATDELLQDASALGGIIQDSFASEFGFKLDDAIIRGNGAGMPLGILNSGCLVTVPAENGQPADSVIFENIVNMYARCMGKNREWYINSELIPQLAVLQIAVGNGGVPVFVPANGAAGRPYNSLLGLPINEIEQCSAPGDVGDIILASFYDYLFADKNNMESAVSIHVRFLFNESAFRFILRADGQPLRSKPITPYKGTKTKSPFVALAAR